ncbi:pyrD [Symbiodinium natans]|uniref:PyrD protein n=1 Tax=Symbiodinium natans TaxID=878477 RepID=A0A812P671_9DINO|nr:pyrD [Symbiodinium natans]
MAASSRRLIVVIWGYGKHGKALIWHGHSVREGAAALGWVRAPFPLQLAKPCRAIHAYLQRLPKRQEDHRLAWRESVSTRLYTTFVAPMVVQTDAETAHNLTLRAGELLQACRLLLEPSTANLPLDWLLRPAAARPTPPGPSLRQSLFGGRLTFDMPVGIAAGFDKNAALVPLYRLGFMELGFAEVGSISAEPAAGNEKPRCWRIPSDQAVINCMGLNNEGAACVAARLKTFSRADGSAPIGINIAKTHSPAIVGPAAVDDFVQSFTTLAPLADFVVINVSCPNTAEGKTFEEPSALADLLSAVARQKKEMKWEKAPPPVLVKLMATPDSEDGRACQRELLRVIEDANVVDGLVISNTIKNPEAQLSSSGRQAADAIGKGGVSGRVIHARSVAAIRSAFEATGGRLPIIGVGGTDSAEAAYEKIRAGASLVEVYTGLVYKGPGLLTDINTGLRRRLQRDGFSCIQEAVGADVRKAH